MALLDQKTYEAFRKELLKKYRQLLKSLGSIPRDKRKLVRDAFDFAAKAHEGIIRKSGEPYIFHPLAVATIASAELGLGPTSVACALLHDVVEDTEVTLEDIAHKFGPKVAAIIDGLTKISAVFDTTSSIQAENFKKMLLTLGEDLRVILIKLCDRLHNMRTLDSVSKNTQLKIASETLYIYAPLAHRLGLNAIKSELEDLALKFTESDLYNLISENLSSTRVQRNRYIKEFIEPLEIKLNEGGITLYEIKGRPKSIYSIAQKMKKQQIPFEQVYDVFAVRVIVDAEPEKEKSDCWKAYSIITDIYRTQANRLRDWLSHPKANGYEALHTTVLGPKGQWVEVQIRSKRMDDIAERGLAAHWKYKSNSQGQVTPQDSSFDNWLSRVKDTLENKSLNALEFLDEFKFSLLNEEIFVFTPKGDVKGLPLGSTALDFAFEIHSEVGARCIGAKVNHKLVPISYELKSGDIVEIITSQKNRVNKDWLDFVKSARAKSKIREFLREEKKEVAKEGEAILRRKIRNQKVKFTEDLLGRLVKYFKFGTPHELYYAIGNNTIKSEQLTLKEILAPKDEKSSENLPQTKKSKDHSAPKSGAEKSNKQIIVGDDFELDYNLAQCCNPIPGDPIFGFITIGEGVKIHRTNCPNAISLMSNHGYRIIKAEWRGHRYEKAFEAKIKVEGIDDVGIVSRITDIISRDMQVNMKSIHITGKEGTFEGIIELFIHDTRHLNELMDKIAATHKFMVVSRIFQ